MHPDLVAKLESGGDFVTLLELGAPFNSKLSKGGLSSKTGGSYADGVIRWSRTSRQRSDSGSGSVPASTISADIQDVDGALSRVLTGEYQDEAVGATFVCRLAERSLSEDKWWTFFAGVLAEAEPQGQRSWTLRARTDDRAFEKYSTFPLKQSEFPDGDPSVWGKEAPAIYGRHESFGSTNGGMVPALLVDKTRNRYLLSRWRLKDVPRVYVAGSPQSSGYSVEHLVHFGRLYTFLTFTENKGASPVTADVHGYETVGDGSGTLIENPAEQIAHALTHSVLSRHSFGDWPAQDARIDSAYLTAAAAFFTRKGMKGSVYVSDKMIGHALLAQWMKTWDAVAFWSTDGKLRFAVDEHVVDVYPDEVFRQNSHDVQGSFRQPQERDVLGSVKVSFVHSATTGNYINFLDVRNPSSVEQDAEDSLEMRWAYNSLADL